MDWAVLGTRVWTFLTKWTRHRCQQAPGSTEAMASTRPWWASETTRATPDSPRAHQAPQERGPAGPVLGGDEVDPQDLPVPVGVDPGGHHHGHVHDPAARLSPSGSGRPPRCRCRDRRRAGCGKR